MATERPATVADGGGELTGVERKYAVSIGVVVTLEFDAGALPKSKGELVDIIAENLIARWGDGSDILADDIMDITEFSEARKPVRLRDRCTRRKEMTTHDHRRDSVD